MRACRPSSVTKASPGTESAGRIFQAREPGQTTGTNKRTATDPFPSKNNNPMQNKLITTLCSGLLAFASTSCDMIEDAYNKATELDAPVLSVTEQFSDGFTISWPAVQNAAGYRYVFETEAEQSTTLR